MNLFTKIKSSCCWGQFLLLVLVLIIADRSRAEILVCDAASESLFQLFLDILDDDNASSLISWSREISWELKRDPFLSPSSRDSNNQTTTHHQDNNNNNNNNNNIGDVLQQAIYSSPEQVPLEVSFCIPRDECLYFVMNDLSVDHFRLQVDQVPVTPGNSHPTRGSITSSLYDVYGISSSGGNGGMQSTTRIGRACWPTTCGAGEILLDMTAFQAGSGRIHWQILNASLSSSAGSSSNNNNNNHHVIQKQDRIPVKCDSDWSSLIADNDNSFLVEDQQQQQFGCFWTEWEVHYVTQCLPSDGCYRLVMNDEAWAFADASEYLELDINFGGNLLHFRLGSFRFETLTFGGQNDNNMCEASPLCPNRYNDYNSNHNGDDAEEQVPFEFFFMRDYRNLQVSGDMTWSLFHHHNHRTAATDNQNQQDAITNGTIGSNDTSINYFFHCVPRDACLTFSLNVPETDVTFSNFGTYQLMLDGQVYIDDGYTFSSQVGGPYAISSTSTALGECQPDQVCNAATEALFNVRVKAASIGKNDVRWFVYNKTNRGLPDAYLTNSMSGYYFGNVVYRHYQCFHISTEECLFIELFWDLKEGAVLQYVVMVDEDISTNWSATPATLYGSGKVLEKMKLDQDTCRAKNEDGNNNYVDRDDFYFTTPQVDNNTGLSVRDIIGISICSFLGLASLLLLTSGIMSLRRTIADARGAIEDDETVKTWEEDDIELLPVENNTNDNHNNNNSNDNNDIINDNNDNDDPVE